MAIPASASQTTFYELGAQDDCIRAFNGSTWSFGNDLVQVGYLDSQHYQMQSIMRFENVQIPVNAIVSNAYITFTDAITDGTGSVSTILQGQIGNATAFSSQADFLGTRQQTSQIPWVISAQWVAGSTYVSPSVTQIVQEIVSNSSWTSGGSMAIFWGDINNGSAQVAGSCKRVWGFTQGGQSRAPTLTVTYDYSGSSYNNNSGYYYGGVWYANGTGPQYNNYNNNSSYPYNNGYTTSTVNDPRIDQIISDDKAMTVSVSSLQSSLSDISKGMGTLSTQIADTKTAATMSGAAVTSMANTVSAIQSNLTSTRGDIVALQTALNAANKVNAQLIADSAAATKSATDEIKTWLIGVVLLQVLVMLILLLIIRRLMAAPARRLRPYNQGTGLETRPSAPAPVAVDEFNDD
jgi:hypothetical protein